MLVSRRMFLALQVLLLLAGAGLCVISVRVGLAVWFALAMQFISFMWMTQRSSRDFLLQAAVFGALYLAVGGALAWGRSTRWWVLPATTVAVLGLLRIAMLFYWLAKAPISGAALDTLGESSLALMAPAVLALLVAHGGVMLARGRPSVPAAHPRA